jgi:hypothetical protein
MPSTKAYMQPLIILFQKHNYLIKEEVYFL